ncbi:ATP phosphoribosyltransferase regulatory subunit [Sulfurovum lithotrophicum]|uniref:ATP phosphoribosyltransferase regulatory subunit n=1 Tax=Sulfurovum lithotrophicum TaxID=206403 RepID=A0A7U4M2K8_9BACT|nr:ATP phosphoribosyltransferase regulatory subunit [Sulfurovum lithotrophicum]AKF25712.1 ATP phosphoribosyltransferase regulatory subunit [Sulfurovum lithotrophicum]
MIFEHEIPSGSRLYFGESARVKREIEFVSAEMLDNLGFEEIVTPIFSYHQHECFNDKKPLVRLNDESNHEVTLRADSTADVVRIVTKRLGRSTESKKWFYIQPTVTFPTREQYQIGAEIIDGSFEEVVRSATILLKEIDIEPVMQIANIRIPHLLNEKYGVSLDVLKSMHVEQIMKTELPWIEHLVRINTVSDLEELEMFPADIREELEKIKEATQHVAYEKMVISPLFYAKMRYYDSLTFRMFEGNSLLAMGGIYSIDGVEAAGFALYTDECIVNKMNRG